METNKNSSSLQAGLLMWGKVFLIVLSIFVGLKAIGALKEYKYIGRGNNAPVNTITVQGTGEVIATPDTADFSYTISEDAATAAAAQDKAATKANAVLAAVKAAGVDAADIKTTSYNLSPKYEYTQTGAQSNVMIACPYNYGTPCPPTGRQTITGYTVSESVDVKVRKIDDAGALIAKITALSVSSVSGVNFVVDKPEAIQDQAKAKAIADAQAKAKVLAKELGVSLSRIANFSDSSGPIYYGKSYAMDSTASSGATPAPVTPDLSIGQNTVTSNVSITYEIE